jgi:hypothetical protein
MAAKVDRHGGLNDVLVWAAGKPKNEFHPHIVAEIVAQDEFTHDVIVPTEIYSSFTTLLDSGP